MATTVSLSDDPRTTCRASSTLDRNKQLYGAPNMLTTDLSSCWNSAQGSPQQVQVLLHRAVDVAALCVMFQGGFVGQDVQVHVRKAAGGGEGGQWEAVDVDVDPEDSNELQEFPCALTRVEAVALTFQRSTDFYGRVVIYRLEVRGVEAEASC
ncbi:Nuclear receptor 2C2-associated protein [Phytophthora cinnamomi]|uniref:Nuclear receptor 2C2-associated protein n=1 Tax=Phytophthora cinnamomi TaxID=4785 RepID=UPI003559BFB8|nr:Nuclear receptor 2C2-associated protein [Phytophthora cinnamomi]